MSSEINICECLYMTYCVGVNHPFSVYSFVIICGSLVCMEVLRFRDTYQSSCTYLQFLNNTPWGWQGKLNHLQTVFCTCTVSPKWLSIVRWNPHLDGPWHWHQYLGNGWSTLASRSILFPWPMNSGQVLAASCLTLWFYSLKSEPL